MGSILALGMGLYICMFVYVFIYILEGEDIYCSSELKSPKCYIIFSFILSYFHKGNWVLQPTLVYSAVFCGLAKRVQVQFGDKQSGLEIQFHIFYIWLIFGKVPLLQLLSNECSDYIYNQTPYSPV